MPIVTQVLGLQSPDKPRTMVDTLLDIVTGGVAGVLLNDLWEIGKFPGYYVNAFPIGDINVGWDDVAQDVAVPIGVGAAGAAARIPGSFSFALGMAAGGVATKLAEQYGNGFKLQIIKHVNSPPITGFAQSNPVNLTENQLRRPFGSYYGLNPTENQLRGIRFSR